MLETKELVKIYKPKKGVPVTALNKVSLKFPEKGMVFLLGKSGSGKSTLLNVLGGLDNYNGGEIIIKGVSSKAFKQKHFDSYRNTYVGFIFQEYNVLDEFTVGANIALAIELQNRKATDKEVNDILKEVDLEGYGNRKPNELSGGQKQRVAIARALVKNPQIIMADEPTGALDSNTGRAIFDTLKKLSTTKLVIVVSHDREFAESYADRIIELSDGVVISDVECDYAVAAEDEVGKLSFNGNVIEVPAGYHITEDDRRAINEYISALNEGKAHISVAGRGGNKFVATDTSKIKAQDSATFKLIKSKLPLKNAFKIGGGGLKYKKFRLVITILLSCISFGLFGLADTFAAYNHIKTCTNSLADSNLNYVTTAKSKRIEEDNNRFYWRDYGYSLSVKDLENLKQNTGVEMHGVYLPLEFNGDFSSHIDQSISLSATQYEIYYSHFNGFTEINEQILDNMGFALLAGALPDGSKNEIAISEYTFEVFKTAKYTDGVILFDKNGEPKKPTYTEIKKYSDILGKTLNLGDVKYTVTAVIDTKFDIDRYVSLTEEKEYKSTADELVDTVLYSEFNSAFSYSYSGLIMVGEGFIEKLMLSAPPITPITEGYIWFYGENCSVDPQYVARLSDVKSEKIVWLDGAKTTLGEKEIIVTTDAINFWEEEETNENYTSSEEYYKAIFKKVKAFDAHIDLFGDTDNSDNMHKGYKIVGFIERTDKSKVFSTAICSDSLFAQLTDGSENIYGFAVGSMPKEKRDINTLVSYCYREDAAVRYQIQNSVTFELDAINEALQELSVIFLYIGLGFAAFAALMLANFIATSISYKKQEIGILRAIGSRSNDVFRIFFAESFIIAMINFVFSAAGVFVATQVINYFLRRKVGILITILGFGPRQIILLAFVSVLVAFIASFFPVKRIASKKPIDAIRNR